MLFHWSMKWFPRMCLHAVFVSDERAMKSQTQLCLFRGVWRCVNVCLPDLHLVLVSQGTIRWSYWGRAPGLWHHELTVIDCKHQSAAGSIVRLQAGAWLLFLSNWPLNHKQIAEENLLVLQSHQTQWHVLTPLSLQLFSNNILSRTVPWPLGWGQHSHRCSGLMKSTLSPCTCA